MSTTATTPSELFDALFDWSAWASNPNNTYQCALDQEINLNVPLIPNEPLLVPSPSEPEQSCWDLEDEYKPLAVDASFLDPFAPSSVTSYEFSVP